MGFIAGDSLRHGTEAAMNRIPRAIVDYCRNRTFGVG